MRNIHVTANPVTLEGYKAVMKPSQYGYSLRAVVGKDLIEKLEEEIEEDMKVMGFNHKSEEEFAKNVLLIEKIIKKEKMMIMIISILLIVLLIVNIIITIILYIIFDYKLYNILNLPPDPTH